MNFPPKPWCAGLLGNCSVKDRFHFLCVVCHWRRAWYGWKTPPYWIYYTMTWNFTDRYLYYRRLQYAKFYPWRVKIDPRGHFTQLRCAAIIVLDKILRQVPRLEKPLIEFCSVLSCHPTI